MSFRRQLATQLRFAAPLAISSSSLRTPPRRSFRRHCASLRASGALSEYRAAVGTNLISISSAPPLERSQHSRSFILSPGRGCVSPVHLFPSLHTQILVVFWPKRAHMQKPPERRQSGHPPAESSGILAPKRKICERAERRYILRFRAKNAQILVVFCGKKRTRAHTQQKKEAGVKAKRGCARA